MSTGILLLLPFHFVSFCKDHGWSYIVYLSLSHTCWAPRNCMLPSEERNRVPEPSLFPCLLPPFPLTPSLSSLSPTSPLSSFFSPYPTPSWGSHYKGKTSVPLFPVHPTLYFEIKFSKAQLGPHRNLLRILQCAPRKSVFLSLAERTSQSGPSSFLTSLFMIFPVLTPVHFFTCNNLIGNGLKVPDGWLEVNKCNILSRTFREDLLCYFGISPEVPKL